MSYYDVSRSMGRIERGPRHVILDEIYLIHLPSAIGSSASAAALTGDHSSAASPSVLRRASRATDVHALQLRGTDDSEHEPESFGVRRLPSNVVRWVSHNSLPVSKDQLTYCTAIILSASGFAAAFRAVFVANTSTLAQAARRFSGSGHNSS